MTTQLNNTQTTANMPSKDTDEQTQTTRGEDVPFSEWAAGEGDLVDTEEEDSSKDTDDELFEALSPKSNKSIAEEQDTDPDATDEDYEVTESQKQKEKDVKFNQDYYVDEVQMKREEDREEAAREEAAAATSAAKQKQKGQQLLIQTTTELASKRKTNARSPAAQMAGALKKKAHVSKGPKITGTTAIYKQVNTNSINRRSCHRLKESSVSTPERNNRGGYQFKTQVTLFQERSNPKPNLLLQNTLVEIRMNFT